MKRRYRPRLIDRISKQLKQLHEQGCFAVLLVIALAIVVPFGLAVIAINKGASEGVQSALMLAGILAVLGGSLAWIGLLRRLRHRRISDPVFGVLGRDPETAWRGQYDADGPVEVVVYADDAGPTEYHRELFTEFKRRSDELRAAVEKPLFDAYHECRNPWKTGYEKEGGDLLQRFDVDFPNVHRSSDIWNIAHLSCIEIVGRHDIDLSLTYDIEWADTDHVLSANIKDWQVLEVGKEG